VTVPDDARLWIGGGEGFSFLTKPACEFQAGLEH
jgi:hypothetical protein